MPQVGSQTTPELVLRFDNSRLIKATQFAKLLRDLASDYKRIYGDDLVIVGVPEGSLIARLRSASKFAEGANHLIDFGKNVAALIGMGVLGVAAANQLNGDSSSPLKAAQSLAALAVQSGSKLEISYTKPGQEELLVRVSPDQARSVKEATDEALRIQKHTRFPELPWRGREEAIPDRTTETDPMNAIRAQLARYSSQEGSLGELPPDVHSLIVALVLALQDAAPYRVSQLIIDLEAEGNAAAAKLIRDIVNDHGPDRPLLRLGS